MGHSRKIATCCYCGRRSELLLTGRDSHELSCASCGAPLHDMKRIPDGAGKSAKKGKKAKKASKQSGKETVIYADPYSQSAPGKYIPHPSRKTKKRKPWGLRLFEEVIDAVEDIFD